MHEGRLSMGQTAGINSYHRLTPMSPLRADLFIKSTDIGLGTTDVPHGGDGATMCVGYGPYVVVSGKQEARARGAWAGQEICCWILFYLSPLPPARLQNPGTGSTPRSLA